MDGAIFDKALYAAILQELSSINRWTLAYRPTIKFLRRALGRAPAMRSFRLLDVGFGYGDMLERIARWAERRGFEAELVGIDQNPMSAAIAQAATKHQLSIE